MTNHPVGSLECLLDKYGDIFTGRVKTFCHIGWGKEVQQARSISSLELHPDSLKILYHQYTSGAVPVYMPSFWNCIIASRFPKCYGHHPRNNGLHRQYFGDWSSPVSFSSPQYSTEEGQVLFHAGYSIWDTLWMQTASMPRQTRSRPLRGYVQQLRSFLGLLNYYRK